MKKTVLFIFIFVFFIALKNNAQNKPAASIAGKQPTTYFNMVPDKNIVPPPAPPHAQRMAGAPLSATAISGYFREGFENSFPPPGWQVVDVLDPLNYWIQQTDPTTAHSGNNNAYCNWSPQTVVGEDWIILPQFTVAATDSFSFFMAPQVVPYPPDTTFILVSTTDSALSSFTTVVDVLMEGLNYPTANGLYAYFTYSLSAFAGQDIYVAFRNVNIWGDGIHIDDVAMGTKPPDAAAYSIDVPKFSAIGTMSPQATVKNDGDSIISFPVTMTITGGYSSTKNVSNLAPGATFQVTFDPWTTVAPSIEVVSIETNLIGDTFLGDDTLSTSITIMEPFTNYGWSSRLPMTAPRFIHSSAAVNNNTASDLFALSGISNTVFTTSTDDFMPVLNTWTPTAAMTKAVSTASAANVKDKIYIAGGYNPNFTPVNNNQIYNPATNSWAVGFNMSSPVGDYAMGVYNDSLIYYMGGYSGTVDRSSVQIFNPASILWVPATSMPSAGAGWRGGILGDKIVVTGGYSQTLGSALKTTYIGTIDPAFPLTITWTTGPDYPCGTMTRMASGSSLDSASGLILFTGGDPSGGGTEAVDYTFAFDVNSNSWKVGPPKPTPANNLCNFTAVVDNDSLYMVALGGNSPGGELDVNEWLNLGPYQVVIGIEENNGLNISLSSLPNPFNDFTEIRFVLSESAKVKATIVDVLGKEMEVLADKNMSAGSQQLIWNAEKYESGIYFCSIYIDGKTATQKLLKY